MNCQGCEATVIDKKTGIERLCYRHVACGKGCTKYCPVHTKMYSQGKCLKSEHLHTVSPKQHVPKSIAIKPTKMVIPKVERKIPKLNPWSTPLPLTTMGRKLNKNFDLPSNIKTTEKAVEFLESNGYEFITEGNKKCIKLKDNIPIYVYTKLRKNSYWLIGQGLYNSKDVNKEYLKMAYDRVYESTGEKIPKGGYINKKINFYGWLIQYIFMVFRLSLKDIAILPFNVPEGDKSIVMDINYFCTFDIEGIYP